jgi:hypothetical protein
VNDCIAVRGGVSISSAKPDYATPLQLAVLARKKALSGSHAAQQTQSKQFSFCGQKIVGLTAIRRIKKCRQMPAFF